MANPNEYNDEKYNEASSRLRSAVDNLWLSGVSESQLVGVFYDAVGDNVESGVDMDEVDTAMEEVGV